MYYILSMDISVAGGITLITHITPIIPIKNSFIFALCSFLFPLHITVLIKKSMLPLGATYFSFISRSLN